MKRYLGIIAVASLVFVLFSCALVQPKTEIELKGPNGNVYLIPVKVGGVNATIKDGKILVDLKDGEYPVELMADTKVFKKNYTVVVKDGKGVVNLEKTDSVAAEFFNTTDGRVLVLANMGGYKGLDVRFESEGSASASGGDAGSYLYIYNAKALGVAAKRGGALKDFMAFPAQDAWKGILKITAVDNSNKKHAITF